MGEREKIMVEGLLGRKQREMDALEIKIERCQKDVAYYSFPAMGIDSIDADATLQAAQELKALLDQRKDLKAEIKKLQGEL